MLWVKSALILASFFDITKTILKIISVISKKILAFQNQRACFTSRDGQGDLACKR